MDELQLTAILDALANLGAMGAAGLVIFGLLTERIVPRARLDEMRSDRQEGVAHAREAMGQITRVEEALERLHDSVEELDRLVRSMGRS